MRADGSGVVHVFRTEGIIDAISKVGVPIEVEQVDVVGPATSVDLRGAGWVEVAVLHAGLHAKLQHVKGQPFPREATLTAPNGATALVAIANDTTIHVNRHCGKVLDEVVLRLYVIGAVHMALGWVTSEGLSVAADGTISDLTIRSFGILRSADMPNVVLTVHDNDAEPVNGSDAVFAATAAAVWSAQGWPQS